MEPQTSVELDPEQWEEFSCSRSRVYRFLAEIFLTPIPPHGSEYSRRIFAATAALAHIEESGLLGDGVELMNQFAASPPGETLEAVQLALAVDRTRLCRGVQSGYGPPPPYESVYRSDLMPTAALREVVSAFREGGFAVSGDLLERPDYVGVELSYMAELCASESSVQSEEGLERLLELEQRFLEEHLLSWISRYTKEMRQQAQTDFFQGFARLLEGFLVSERRFLADALNPGVG